MCNNYTQQNWEELFDKVWSNSQDDLSLARLIQQLTRFPKDGFKHLLLGYFCQAKRVSAELLEERLLPKADQLYMGMIVFNNCYEQFVLNVVHADTSDDLAKELAYLRRFCRKMLITAMGIGSVPLPGKKQINAALTRMSQTDLALKQAQQNKKLPFDAQQVFSNLAHYLEKGQALADSPVFLPLYLSADELNPLENDLENKRLTVFSKKYIKKVMLQGKIQQIKGALRKIIYDEGIAERSMQAYAVYLTVNKEEYEVVDHPFIRRFIYNSFLEKKLQESIGK